VVREVYEIDRVKFGIKLPGDELRVRVADAKGDQGPNVP
jgi:hypothetical protein